MPRLNTGLEVFKDLSSVTKYQVAAGTHGNTTIATQRAVGDQNALITAITNFANGDPVFITGANGTELNALNATPNTTQPMLYRSAFVFPVGSTFEEAVAIPVGHIDESGLTFGGSLTLTPVLAATSRTPIAFISGQADLTFSFNLRGFNILNFQTVFGAPESEIGVGTAVDPYQGAVGSGNVGTQGQQAFRFVGTRHDGSTVQLDILDAKIEVNVNTQLGGQTPAVLPATGKCTNFILRHWI